MPRLNNLDDVLFPVEEHPVFVKIKEPFGERGAPVSQNEPIVCGRRLTKMIVRAASTLDLAEAKVEKNRQSGG